MNDNADIANVDQPERVIEAKSGQEIARCIIAKRCITEHTT